MLLLTGKNRKNFGYNKSVNFIVDLLFPKRCVGCKKLGSYLCENCFASISFSQSYFCSVCSRPSYNGLTHPKCKNKYSIDGIFPILNYHGLLKKIIYQYKYNPHLSDLTDLLGNFLYEGIIQNEIVMREIEKKNCVIIPVPLHGSREKRRGYNQSRLLAEFIAEKLDLEVESQVLMRGKKTSPQFSLPKEIRRKNIKDAFYVRLEGTVQNKEVLLIDDITTTGATFLECARVLKHKGVVRVYGIALGHEEK